MKFIIIPVCETTPACKGYLDNLLSSIRENGYYDSDYHVILCYDNCSLEFQKYFFEKYHGDRIMAIDNRNPKNLNFCKNINTGFRAAYQMGGEHFILLNQDTVLPPSWDFDELCGEGLFFPTPVDSRELMFYDATTLVARTRTPVLKYSGFCMILSRSVVDKVGFLDERFTASFEDDDLAVRVKLAGFPVEVLDIYVHHELKDRTTPSNTGAYTERDLSIHLDIFRRKYSIPPGVAHEQFNQWILDNFEWHEAFKCL